MAYEPRDSAGDSTASRVSDNTSNLPPLSSEDGKFLRDLGRQDPAASDRTVTDAGFTSARDLLPESAVSKSGDSGVDAGDRISEKKNRGVTTENFDGFDKATSLKMENGGERTFGRNEDGDLKNVKMEDGQDWKKNEKTGHWRSLTEKSNGTAGIEVETARDVAVSKDGTVNIQLDHNLSRVHYPDGSATLTNKMNDTKIDFDKGSPTEVRNTETGTKYEYQRDKDGGLNEIKQDGKPLYQKDGDNWADANGEKLSGEPKLNEYTGKLTAKYPDGKSVSYDSDGSRVENRPAENGGGVTEADFKRPQNISMDKLGGGEQILKDVTSLRQISDRDTGSRSTFKTADDRETTVETDPSGKAYTNKGLEMGRDSFGGLNNIRQDGETLYQKRGGDWFDKGGNQMDKQSVPHDFDKIKRVDVHPDSNTFERYSYDGSTSKTVVNEKNEVQSRQDKFASPQLFEGTTAKGEPYQVDGVNRMDLTRDQNGQGFTAKLQAGNDSYDVKLNAAGKAIGKPVKRQPVRAQ